MEATPSTLSSIGSRWAAYRLSMARCLGPLLGESEIHLQHYNTLPVLRKNQPSSPTFVPKRMMLA